jgi:hypothetical protein
VARSAKNVVERLLGLNIFILPTGSGKLPYEGGIERSVTQSDRSIGRYLDAGGTTPARSHGKSFEGIQSWRLRQNPVLKRQGSLRQQKNFYAPSRARLEGLCPVTLSNVTVSASCQ